MKISENGVDARVGSGSPVALARRLGAVSLAALLAGCGNIPDAKVSYHLASSELRVKVVRSVACNTLNQPIVVTAVTPTVVHSAARDDLNLSDGATGNGPGETERRSKVSKTQSFNLNWFRGHLSDADVKVEFYEDNRLKAVNATLAGQGEAVLKLAAGAFAILKSSKKTLATDPDFPAECGFISAQTPSKAITLVYEGKVNLDQLGTRTEIEPEVGSRVFHRRVSSAIGTVWAVAKDKGSPAVPFTQNSGGGDSRFLTVVQPGWVGFDVQIDLPASVVPPEAAKAEFSGRATIAQFGALYQLPVPRPAPFGKQTFGAAFLESGALSSVQYSSAGGAAQALGGLNSLLGAAQGSTTAQEAAEVKAEADLIAQQQRLVLCLADPEKCPK